MIGVALSGKTTYVKANFDHEVIALPYFDNNRKKELRYIEECLKEGKNVVVDDTNLTREIRNRIFFLPKNMMQRQLEFS